MSPFNKKVTAAKNYLQHMEDAIFWHSTYMLRKRGLKALDPVEFKGEYNNRLRSMVEALQERNLHLNKAKEYKAQIK